MGYYEVFFLNNQSLPMSLTKFEEAEQAFQAEVKVDADGVGRASIRGVARLAGVDQEAIRKPLNAAEISPSKMVKMLIEQGFGCVDISNFSKTGVPDQAVAVILEYYAFEAGSRCTESARNAYRAFGRIGIRVWMQQLSGWQSGQSVASLREFIAAQLPALIA